MQKSLINSRMNIGKAETNGIPITIAMYVMMFAYALSTTLIGPLVIVFIKQYGISLADNGLVTLGQGIGGVLFLIMGIFYGDRLSKPTWIIITFSLYSVSIGILGFASAYFQIVILFFFIGASTRMLDAMMNAYIADIHQEKRSFFLNILHACYGAGALAGPMLSSLFIVEKIQINLLFFALGIFCILTFC
ncbi:MAG TPA: MFS transporter, partial [Anaerovoracaceae bacterium]|nr:MFS transporter [Anaerovoracaceae bacterium]